MPDYLFLMHDDVSPAATVHDDDWGLFALIDLGVWARLRFAQPYILSCKH
jgi:hypothetical protein